MLHIGKGESNLKKGKLPNFDNKIKLTHLIIACLAVAIVTAILTYVAAIGGFGSKQYFDDARRYVEIEETDRIKFQGVFYRIISIEDSREFNQKTIICERVNE